MAEETNNQQPQKQNWNLTHFQGFQCRTESIPDVLSFQKHFQALQDDIVLASKPKSGTTWLKSLAFTIVNRHRFTLANSPLHLSNPHDLVPFFEMDLYNKGQLPDLITHMSSPRLFATHLPYQALSESIKNSNARIVYITRNPLDVIVSKWHFATRKPGVSDWSLDECFEMYCRGEEGYGPFWDHVLGYWKQSIEKPNKVLFLKYEEMKEKPVDHIKKIAEFIGCPFSEKEEKEGAVDEIAEFCSFSNLKNVEANKKGNLKGTVKRQTKDFFRKGEAGDYVNFLSPSAVERFSKILEEKLSGSDLTFNVVKTQDHKIC